MRTVIQTKDVFTPGKTPESTYNKREQVGLEKKLRFKLDSGGSIIILSGPSKIGKTVLMKKVISDEKRVIIQGDSFVNEEGFLETILRSLGNIPAELKKQDELVRQKDHSTELGGGIKPSFWSLPIIANVGHQFKNTSSLKQNESMMYIDDPFKRAVDYMIENEYTLVIDDFHYIEGGLQKKLIHKLKEPLGNGLKIVIALIPTRTKVVIQKEPDMQGRTTTIDVPLWEDDELAYIPDNGFEKLNVLLKDEIKDELVLNSFGNPQLMQMLCSNLCMLNDIYEKQETTLSIPTEGNNLTEVYREVVETNDHTLNLLERGKAQGKTMRTEYLVDLKNSETRVVDRYQLILMALGSLAHKNKIPFNDLQDEIKKMHPRSTDGEVLIPRTSDIANTLNNLTKIAADQNEKDPVLEYKDKKSEDTIYMYDAFFSFNLKFKYL